MVPAPGLEPGSSPYKGRVLTFELRWRRLGQRQVFERCDRLVGIFLTLRHDP